MILSFDYAQDDFYKALKSRTIKQFGLPIQFIRIAKRFIAYLLKNVAIYSQSYFTNQILIRSMFSNAQTDTRIVVFKNQTIVVSRVKENSKQFRIYIDGKYNGILELTNEEWTLTPGYSLPKGVFTLLTKRIGIH